MGIAGVAKKMYAWRQANALTIQQMADRTGLSTALISQLERGLGNPSLGVLEALAKTVGLTVAQLLEDEVDEESLVLRVAEREKTYHPSDKYMFYNLLTPDLMKSSIHLTLVHLAPHSETYGEQFHCHRDEEVVFMLAGSVTVVFEFSRLALYTGDTLRIPGNKKHRYANKAGQPAELLTIKTNRSY